MEKGKDKMEEVKICSELIKVESVNVMEVFTSDGLDPILKAIKAEVESFVPDIETAKGRKEIASLANKVSKSKVLLDNLGKDLTTDWKQKAKKVDESRKRSRDYLDNLKVKVRKPLTDWENIEKERFDKHTDKLKAIGALWMFNIGLTVSLEMLKINMEKLEAIVIDSSWEEFEQRASEDYALAHSKLTDAISIEEKRVESEKELARLKKNEEVRLQKEKEEKIRTDAEAKVKKEAEEKVKQDKIDADNKIQKANEAKVRSQEKLKQEKIKAKELEAKTERDKIAAEKKAKEDKEKAEKLATKREQDRVAAAEKKEKDKKEAREKDVEHRKEINNNILNALKTEALIPGEAGKGIITAIALGKIPNVTINY